MAYALDIKINTISSLTAYLISNNLGEKRKAVIADNKGYYISAMNEKNKIIVDEYYSDKDDLDYKEVPHKLDIEKIIEYTNDMKSENPHHIKANYVKRIEVENHD